MNQSDTVSIPAVAPGQPIPTRVIASAEPPRYTQPRCPPSRNLTVPVCKQSVSACMELCVMNCCSMKEKTRLPSILDHVRDNKCDLVALTETWLSPDVSKNASVVQECADYGYKLFHIPRPTKRGGGVKDNISIVRNKLPHLAHTTFEHIELLITSISIHIRLVVVYRPPQSNINKNTKLQFIEEFGDFVEKLSACSGTLLLCGDFNINWMDNDNSCVKIFFNLLETYNLVQHITEPTHRSQHLLDYIISDAELVNSAGVSDFVSDHCALHASLVRFLITKIDIIRHEFPILEQNLPMPFSINFNVILDLNLVSSLTYFKHTTVDEVNVLLSKMDKTTCMFDPFPTRFLLNFSHLFIDVIVRIINLTFSTASFPAAFKSAVVKPLLKKLHLTAIF